MTTKNTSEKTLLGHPFGLSTLFFTEMWERMSYYGMRAMLVLFMTAAMQDGGLGITVASATAIYGLYTGSVYFMGLPGGWIADRLVGGQRAVWYGGIIIMCGHIVLAIPSDQTFFLGLMLVVLGTGLLKPNIAALVGGLYGKNDDRRDSGFTIYYLGINIGSLIGYGVCGYLRIEMGWHWAFGAAAVGMAIGLVIFYFTRDWVGESGRAPVQPLTPQAQKRSWTVISVFMLALITIAVLMINGVMSFDPVTVAQYVAIAITIVFLLYYAAIFFKGDLNQNEKRRMGALFLVCLASIFFWTGFEQAGSSLNLFGQDYTNRFIGSFEFPPEWLQSANSFFIIVLSPFFAYMWFLLTKRMITPSYGFKCGIGLIIMATGFLVMYFAAQYAASGLKVAPTWLVSTYFLHTVGELCLSPVALSAVSKLSPKRFAGQMMGVFTLTYAIGNVIAGLLAGNFDPENVQSMPSLFWFISMFTIAIGVVVLIFTIKTRHWERLPEKPSELDAFHPAVDAENHPPKV